MSWYRRWKRSRKKVERCEVCGAHLRRKDVVAVSEASVLSTEFGIGGGGITAIYCRKDAPKEAA